MRADPAIMPEVIRVKRSSAIYNAHAYLTKVPEEAIIPFIENFTQPGDLVADPFAGSGMTGVAALMTGRRAALSDISRLGQHIGENYCRVVGASKLRRLGQSIIRRLTDECGEGYQTPCMRCGKIGEIRRVVWSEVFQCRECGVDVIFYETVYDEHRKEKRHAPICHNGHPFIKRKSVRVGEAPVEVHYTCSCSQRIIERRVTPEDVEQIARIDSRPIEYWWPNLAFDQTTEMFRRSALTKNGRVRLADFYSRRNLNALACLWHAIADVEEREYREKLRFAFTAILTRASKRYQWGPKRPLNAQNQTYYVAPVFYEWNVLDLFTRKLEAVIDAMQMLRSWQLPADRHVQATLWLRETREDDTCGPPQVEYRLASAHDLRHLATGSVDYVFTDPPFGSSMFYSDMSFFMEAWLGEFTDPAYEAVVRTTDRLGKSLESYRQVLSQALCEIHRILKPGRWATIVFSSSTGDVWRAFQRAVADAGFILQDTQISTLDKGQRSVKGLASDREDVVTADLMLSVRKPNRNEITPAVPPASPTEINAVVGRVIAEYLREPGHEMRQIPVSYLYLAVIRTCLREHIDVEAVNMDRVAEILRHLGCHFDSKTQMWVLEGNHP